MSSTKQSLARPLLIELEGIDGAGKTSAHKTFSDLLTANGIKHIGTREAGNPNIPLCVKLRKMALHDLAIEDHEARECVFAAKRILNRKWYRSLDPDIVVVSDRGWGYLSHLAYGYAVLPKEQIDALFKSYCKPVNEDMKPHVIYLRIDPEEAHRRTRTRGEAVDNVEALGIEHQRKVAANFDDLLKDTSLYEHAWEVDANQDQAHVKEQLRQIVAKIKELRPKFSQ